MATAIEPDCDQDSVETVRSKFDDHSDGKHEHKKAKESRLKSGDQNSGATSLETHETLRSNILSSKLGNGDYFHNPENLVQFVISGN